MTNPEDVPWLVRRIKSPSGNTMAHPRLWGRVNASSETIAVTKFVHLLRIEESPTHFSAEPIDGPR